jgi:hypothetical protein
VQKLSFIIRTVYGRESALCAADVLKSLHVFHNGRISTAVRLMPPVREICGSNSGKLATVVTSGFPRLFPTLGRMTG